MKTKTKKIPKLRRQKGRDLGYVSISGRKTYLKGKYTDDGADSQLKASYRRFVEQFEAREETPNGCNTIAELLKAFAIHHLAKAANVKGCADRTHKATEESKNTISRLVDVLDRWMSQHPSVLGVEEYNLMRQWFMSGRSLTTTTLRKYFGDVRTFVSFGVGRGLMPLSCKIAIDALPNITTSEYPQLKDPVVREAADVDDVRQTMLHLNYMIQTMVMVSMATGMRPMELCNLRWTEIDRSGKLWEFIPANHKTEKKGKSRIVYFRPEVQTLLRRWQSSRPLKGNDYLFTGRESWILGRLKMLGEKTTMQEMIDASAGKHFTEDGVRTRVFRQAITNGCKRAGVPRWTPYQMRHFYATEMLKTLSNQYADGGVINEAMIEGVAALLGHSDIRTTRRYTGASNALAARLTMTGDSVVAALIS